MAEIVSSAHAHDDERLAPLDTSGERDDAHGIGEFVAGTSGRSLAKVGTLKPNSEVRDSSTCGVLRLSLDSNHYEREFIPVAGGAFSDSGSAYCHGNS